MEPFDYDFGSGLDHTLLILSPVIPGRNGVYLDILK
jgi:hypothetical protein